MVCDLIDREFLVDKLKCHLAELSSQGDLNPDLSWVVSCLLNEVYKEVIVHTYGNQSQAARILGMHRSSYCKKLRHANKK
ncbi:hypothetical protein V12B01_07698 [Vibrio splendidus 12B01]|uniref:helix-turn-helix domain-containing protein n=1 Tax=Vibrio splendidus TaxID=29497 RepID=UPI000066FD0A|nr:helix-turn-helix domain-containing protein [Vibrio splendidus]EAP94242.1 hypothetical protein V12B01_07698 [Vibrio splendidus 12B01]OCH64341.1 hypothetical protein A6D94_13150 [Vibrio splendidus]